MYQQYRLEGFKVRFKPLATETVNQTSGVVTEVVNVEQQIRAAATTIVLVPEHDDFIVRQDNLDEYYQAVMLPHSQSFLSTERGELYVRATIMQSAADTTADTNGGGLYTAPRRTPWLSTKYDQDESSNVIFNDDIVNYGFKVYVYNPYWSLLAPVTTQLLVTRILGTLSIQAYWQFRNLDNRALLTPSVLLSMVGSEQFINEPVQFSLENFRSSRTPATTLVAVSEENGDPIEKPQLKRQRAVTRLLE